MTDYDPTLDPNKNQIQDYDGGQRQQDARYANIPPRPKMPTGALGNAPEGSLVPPALLRALQEYALLIEYAWMMDADLKKRHAEYLVVIRRQADLNNLNKRVQTPVSAWCADYTEGLTGTVATLEVPGEVDPTIGGGLNIKPGDADDAAWNAAYGQIQMGTVLTPAAFAWNFTMLTPWMKWRPLWRYATVVAVNGVADTLNLTLHPILSKTYSWLRRDPTINDPWASSMTGVAVRYMSCGAAVFEPGDDVIVEFTRVISGTLETLEPTVIGFKAEPRRCEVIFYCNQYGEVFTGAPNDDSPITWKESTRYSVNRQTSFVPVSGGGNIFGESYQTQSSVIIRVTRTDKTGAVVWQIFPNAFNVLHYDIWNDRLIIDESSSDRGDAVFLNLVTGETLGSTNLTLATGFEEPQSVRRLLGTAADAQTGQLIYATGNARIPYIIHIGDEQVLLNSIYPCLDESGANLAHIHGLCASENFIFVLIFDFRPMVLRVLQLTKWGTVFAVVQAPGNPDNHFSVRFTTVISGAGIAPPMPPPPPPEEDPPP